MMKMVTINAGMKHTRENSMTVQAIIKALEANNYNPFALP
jgi:hypothetical protein